MKKSVIFIAALLAGLLCSMTASAQHLEIEEEISQSNLPTRNADYKEIQLQSTVPSTSSSVGSLHKGYRGMVELGGGTAQEIFQIKFSTTYGYQFNPFLFLGGFIGLGTEPTPIYDNRFNFRCGADFRTYMYKGKIVPYAGLQLGYDYWLPTTFEADLFPNDSLYLSCQLGVRFTIQKGNAVNLAIQLGSATTRELVFKIGYEF